MRYSVVIPTYNNCEKYLKPCVESILKHTSMDDLELIISANGCTDNTFAYLNYLGTSVPNLRVVWNDKPIGYPRATNKGIELASANKIVLLNNDIVLLDQPKNQWLEMLEAPFLKDSKVGITGPIVQHSPEAGHDFCVFFCVMIDRKVFNKIGLLNEEYGVGAGEDTEFCIEAVNAGFSMAQVSDKHLLSPTMYGGIFPIYHKGEGTVHDPELVPDFKTVFFENSLRLAKKYNIEKYNQMVSAS